MFTQTQKIIAGSLLIATSAILGVTSQTKAADASWIGGGGTCTPHEVFYQQYIPGYYNDSGEWVPSHYETRSRMSTECNSPTPQAVSIRPGDWYTNNDNSGATTHIFEVDRTTYRFMNEVGSVETGYVTGNTVNVPGWNVTGTINNEGQQILWSNGTAWTRYGNQPSYTPTSNKPGFFFNLHL